MDLYDLFDFEEKLNSEDESQNTGRWLDLFVDSRSAECTSKAEDFLRDSSGSHTTTAAEPTNIELVEYSISTSMDGTIPSSEVICFDVDSMWNDDWNFAIEPENDDDDDDDKSEDHNDNNNSNDNYDESNRVAWFDDCDTAADDCARPEDYRQLAPAEAGDIFQLHGVCSFPAPPPPLPLPALPSPPSSTMDHPPLRHAGHLALDNFPATNGHFIQRSGRKRRAYNLHGGFGNNPKRIPVVSLVPKQSGELLVLPNGEVYRRVKVPAADSEIQIGEDLISECIFRDVGPDSPAESCDSGLSIGSQSPGTTCPPGPPGGTPTPIQPSLPSYNLSEALFADPPIKKGVLILTDEEKNCLESHGHPIPKFLPLDKEQEKYMKKIRRKIKNKVAAQESRRRRKEYTDMLESKMKQYQKERQDLLEKLKNLEKYNSNLVNQIKTLGEKVRLTQPSKGGACLMMLVLSFSLFIGSWDIKSWNIGYGSKFSANSEADVAFLGGSILGPNLPKLERMLDDKKQKVLGHGPIIEHPLVENYFDIKTTAEIEPIEQAKQDPVSSPPVAAATPTPRGCSILTPFFSCWRLLEYYDCESSKDFNSTMAP